MPRNDKNKPVPTRSKTHVPVVLQRNYRGYHEGETQGFLPKRAAELVNAGVARFLDDEARQMAERAGFREKAKVASTLDAEVHRRAEDIAAKIVAGQQAAMEEKMADIVSANKKGGAAHAKFEAAIAAKNAEIAKLQDELAKRDG